MIGLAYLGQRLQADERQQAAAHAGGLQAASNSASSHRRCWRRSSVALGAIPQVMAFSEVYQALQTGVVDGQENTPSNMYTRNSTRCRSTRR